MKKNAILTLFLPVLMFSCATGCSTGAALDPPDPLGAFYGCVSTEYPLSVINQLSEYGTNAELGFRTAGSAAERAAAEYLYDEMRSIGLQNVAREKITVDSWEFTKAELAFEDGRGAVQRIEMASYATQYVCKDEEAALIYAGRGTQDDYRGIDAEGKLVLIDINQQEDWWISWPACQASLKGAKAVIAINDGGYFQYSGDTLGVLDIRGQKSAPAFSVTKDDGDMLKRLLADSEAGEITVKLTADSRVDENKAAYSIIGEIPGASDEAILVAAHYDGYFRAFDDNASGVGAVLGIAKALIDSGYAPQKTIRFILHPAGKWGLAGSRYDSSRGAYLTLNNHPEWAESAFALISIDGGVTSNCADGIEISASWEISDFAMGTGYDVEGSPFRYFDVVCPETARFEGFSYAQQGIPVISSGFSGVGEQTEEVCNSNMDTEDYFLNEDAFVYAQKLYGTYLIELDRQPVKPLDYISLFEKLLDAIDRSATPGAAALEDALYDAIDAARDLSRRIEDGDWEEGREAAINAELFKISKAVQEKLISLTWEDEVVFPHERYQRNAAMIEAAISALNDGDGDAAIDGCLSEVDLCGYARYFDRETCDYFAGQVLGKDAVNSWGSGYVRNCADLFDAVRRIKLKMAPPDEPEEAAPAEQAAEPEAEPDEAAQAEELEEAPGEPGEPGEPADELEDEAPAVAADYVAEIEAQGYIAEIKALEIELVNQQKLLKDAASQMTKDVISITRAINRLIEQTLS